MIQHTNNNRIYLFVEVPENAEDLRIKKVISNPLARFTNTDKRTTVHYFIYAGMQKMEELPKGNWQIIGKADELTENQAMSMFYDEYKEGDESATPSLWMPVLYSFLNLHNFSPQNVLILQKIN